MVHIFVAVFLILGYAVSESQPAVDQAVAEIVESSRDTTTVDDINAALTEALSQ